MSRHKGSATHYRGLQGAARTLLRKGGRFDDAPTALHKADIDRRRGHWRGSMLLALGETLAAAGRQDEALATYRAALADDSVEAGHRKTAEEAIKAIEGRER